MKAVGIAELKARLSEYHRGVRRGDTLTVLDRETPIARIVPYANSGAALRIRPRLSTAPELRRIPLPPPLKVRVDAVALLPEASGAAPPEASAKKKRLTRSRSGGRASPSRP